MRKLQIAATPDTLSTFKCERTVVDFDHADLTEVSAVVMTAEEATSGKLEKVEATAFGIPVIVVNDGTQLPAELVGKVVSVIDRKATDAGLYGRQIDKAAKKYEEKMLPPFFGALEDYCKVGYAQFDCPGHQGGAFFRRHPAGREFYNFFGENLFRSDLCNADVAMGDLLIHEGAPCAAQQAAAKVYNADKTYFVLNGTSASNKVVLNALLAPGDLVLFDRNNHKSNAHGALLQAGATPVYLETARNGYGFIGGIDEHCFDEKYLRDLVREVAPNRADEKRPFRLAIIQLGTYDGTIYNARQVVDRIGHLCDYILFDSAWVGYEQFIPMMKDCSPLLLELGPDDPGIFVTQSVHKQQAGFSQTSQIHKKDSHIKGQKRYCPHKRLNNAFMMHASTSPFYALFAALDVNAKMHEGESGRRLWADCVRVVIDARKLLLKRAAGEAELRPVGEGPGQNSNGSEKEGVDRPQPQKAPIQLLSLGLVPRRQPGEVGEELEVEVDGRHGDEQVHGPKSSVQGPAQQGEDPVRPRPHPQQHAQRTQQGEVPLLFLQTADGRPQQEVAHEVGENVDGTQVDVEVEEKVGPGGVGHPPVQLLMVWDHGASPPSTGRSSTVCSARPST